MNHYQPLSILQPSTKKMKNALFVALVLLMSAVVYYKFGENDESILEATTEIDITSSETQSHTTPYAIKYINDVSKLTLKSNLLDKSPAYELSRDCEFLVNGGFYSETDSHIGLFVSEFEQLSAYQDNYTFNGFLYFDNTHRPVISDTYPVSVRVALQSGPIIKLDSTYRKLNPTNDKNARRVIAATTIEKGLAFIIVYETDSKLFGPKLSELPTILQEIERSEGVVFDSAINLDGGSASSFYDNDTKFTESSAIGSYFCLVE